MSVSSGGRLEAAGEPPVGKEDAVEPPEGKECVVDPLEGKEGAVEPPVGEEGAVEPLCFGNLAFFLETKSSMLPEKSSLVE